MAMEAGPFSDQDLNAFELLKEKRWVRVDPATKKAHESARESFFKIDHFVPATKAGGNVNAPVMDLLVQRYHRNKTYEAQIEPNGGNVTRNLPWNEYADDGSLLRPGNCWVPYPEFLKQFKEDGAA